MQNFRVVSKMPKKKVFKESDEKQRAQSLLSHQPSNSTLPRSVFLKSI
jgi:hypothetical protein